MLGKVSLKYLSRISSLQHEHGEGNGGLGLCCSPPLDGNPDSWTKSCLHHRKQQQKTNLKHKEINKFVVV